MTGTCGTSSATATSSSPEPCLEGAEQSGRLSLQVVERPAAAAVAHLFAGLRHGGHHLAAADAAVLHHAAAAAVHQHPADLSGCDLLGQPLDAHLALASGEAADAGDFRSARDRKSVV